MNISPLSEKAKQAAESQKPASSLLRRLGIHPTVAAAFILIDWLLFGGELFSMGAALPVSIAVGIVMALWAAVMQKKKYGDPWSLAVTKGVLLGVLTAIPSPIASFLTLLGGIVPLLDKFNDTPRGGSQNPPMKNITPGKQDHE